MSGLTLVLKRNEVWEPNGPMDVSLLSEMIIMLGCSVVEYLVCSLRPQVEHQAHDQYDILHA